MKGNTWVAEGIEWIPFYRLDEKRVVLLDTGLPEEREDLENSLLGAGLTPAGVLCSHAHVDHCAGNGYFQEKYGAEIALTFPEAGMCANLLTLKCYFLTLPLGTVEREAGCMIHEPDILIPPGGPFSFCGALFQIIHTPGHSAGHICTVTPDGVCYAADALLSAEMLEAKLPYNLNHAMAMESREKLRDVDCSLFVMAHRGMCPAGEIGTLIDQNQDLTRRRAAEVLELMDRPMTASEIDQAVCRRYKLFTHRFRRALRFQRNASFLIEYLLDRGELTAQLRDGVVFYEKTERN